MVFYNHLRRVLTETAEKSLHSATVGLLGIPLWAVALAAVIALILIAHYYSDKDDKAEPEKRPPEVPKEHAKPYRDPRRRPDVTFPHLSKVATPAGSGENLGVPWVTYGAASQPVGAGVTVATTSSAMAPPGSGPQQQQTLPPTSWANTAGAHRTTSAPGHQGMMAMPGHLHSIAYPGRAAAPPGSTSGPAVVLTANQPHPNQMRLRAVSPNAGSPTSSQVFPQRSVSSPMKAHQSQYSSTVTLAPQTSPSSKVTSPNLGPVQQQQQQPLTYRTSPNLGFVQQPQQHPLRAGSPTMQPSAVPQIHMPAQRLVSPPRTQPVMTQHQVPTQQGSPAQRFSPSVSSQPTRISSVGSQPVGPGSAIHVGGSPATYQIATAAGQPQTSYAVPGPPSSFAMPQPGSPFSSMPAMRAASPPPAGVPQYGSVPQGSQTYRTEAPPKAVPKGTVVRL